MENLRTWRTSERKIQVSTTKCQESIKFLHAKYTAVNTNREKRNFGTNTNKTKLVKPKIYRRYVSDEKPSAEALSSHSRQKANTGSRQSTQFAKQTERAEDLRQSSSFLFLIISLLFLQHMKTKLDLSESFFNNKASLGFIFVSFVLCSVISCYSHRTKLYSHLALKLFLQINKKKISLQIYRENMVSLTKGEKRRQLTFKLMQYLKTWLSCIRQIKKYTLNFKAEDMPTSSDMYVKGVL